MPSASPPVHEVPAKLSLVENLVLGVVAEEPTYGFAVARLLEPEADLGRVYRIPRSVVYRTIEHLVAAGLLRPSRVERGNRGPQRTLITATPAGRQAVQAWLAAPVLHVREVRTDLLVKLALLARAGGDGAALLAAQRDVLAPIVAALREQVDMARGFERTLALWRFETADAALRFVDRVTS